MIATIELIIVCLRIEGCHVIFVRFILDWLGTCFVTKLWSILSLYLCRIVCLILMASNSQCFIMSLKLGTESKFIIFLFIFNRISLVRKILFVNLIFWVNCLLLFGVILPLKFKKELSLNCSTILLRCYEFYKFWPMLMLELSHHLIFLFFTGSTYFYCLDFND